MVAPFSLSPPTCAQRLHAPCVICANNGYHFLSENRPQNMSKITSQEDLLFLICFPSKLNPIVRNKKCNMFDLVPIASYVVVHDRTYNEMQLDRL